MPLQSLDIERRSATTTAPPSQRETVEVAKLIDISKCIGCKACQSACMEWNDLRDAVGDNIGTYDNPRDLTENSWTVMKFFEVEDCDSGCFAAGAGGRRDRNQRFEASGYCASFADGRIDVGDEVGRVGRVEVGGLRRVDDRTAADGDVAEDQQP